MKLNRSIEKHACQLIILTALLFAGSISAAASENLGTVLRKTGWDRMIGTWVDADTKGKKLKSVTTWRFKDHVIECTNEDFLQGKKDISLTGFNPKKNECFFVSADNKGGSGIGKWVFTKDDAVLYFGHVTPEKQEGFIQIKYELIDDDTMIASFSLHQPIVIKMIRVKE